MHVHGILETCLYVDDLDAAQRFYRDVLGLKYVGRQDGRHVFFCCGDRMLLLFDPEETRQPQSEVPQHGARGPGHIAFRVEAGEVDNWLAHLEAHGVVVEKIVDWPLGGRSVYFRDPAGNSLEVATATIWEGLGI